MRGARLLVVLFLLATSSSVLAATKAIKFGKLVDGTGRVYTNAVIIVEDDRVQNVASNASIPSGAEVIDLSRYTGLPGLIDGHTHITYYWDGITTPRYEPPRHPAITVFLAQENAQKALEAGVTTIRNPQRRGWNGSGDARSGQHGQDDRPPHVRLGSRHPDHAEHRATCACRHHGRRSGCRHPRRPASHRVGGRLGEDVRIDGWLR